MANKNRDEFTEKTKLQIAKRAGWLCSDPSCRRSTIGSNSDGDGEINLGTAAHICAAAPDGPRYDTNQTRSQRRSAYNGIWMCRLHGTAVDARDSKFTVEHVPSENWKGAYNVVPVAAVELRRRLLAMTTDGGPTDAAARCLTQIDKIRDQYGAPDSEPRHPDLGSRKPWPMMKPDPDMGEAE